MDNFRAARILKRERPLFVQAPEQWAAFALGRLTVKTLHRLRVLLDLEAIQTRVPQGQGARVDERGIEWKRGRRWAEYQMDPIVFDKQGRPHDDDNSDFTIRLPERWPRGVTQLSDEEWSVAVPTGYEEVIDAFIASSERTLELVPEPTNKLDPNAIKVIGHWRDARGCEKEGKVGYLPRDAAAILADRDRRMTLHACAVSLFLADPEHGRSGGIRFKLGCSAADGKPAGCLVLVLAVIGSAVLASVL